MKPVYISLLALLLIFPGQQTKAQNNDGFDQVLQNYLSVEKALVNDDSNAANTSATALVKSIKQVNLAQSNSAEKAVWTKYSEKLRFNSQHISESKSIAHQREHFAALSTDMYNVLKTFKSNTTVYRQYCPMKKQYWLNASANIQNPYYGKEMLDCGKITETIKGSSH